MRKILIVDDEPAITRLVKLNLEATGRYEVFTENKGREAIAAVRLHRPDLVILDIMMPDMLGNEIAAQLQDDSELRDTKVVFLTAILKKSEESTSGRTAGNQIILAKPLSSDELLRVIDEVLA
jgi:CheY-like chemotaxis protein